MNTPPQQELFGKHVKVYQLKVNRISKNINFKPRKRKSEIVHHRCEKHKDFNETWFCGDKCFKNPQKFLKIYYPFDYIYNPETKTLITSKIRYYLK